MSELEGIKDFIEENKQSLENMNQEMIARCGHVPLVWLTVEEAYDILWDMRDLYKQTYGYEWVKNEPWFDEFKKRIQRAEGK